MPLGGTSVPTFVRTTEGNQRVSTEYVIHAFGKSMSENADNSDVQ